MSGAFFFFLKIPADIMLLDVAKDNKGVWATARHKVTEYIKAFFIQKLKLQTYMKNPNFPNVLIKKSFNPSIFQWVVIDIYILCGCNSIKKDHD
jgi:hypothetical protein